MTCAPCHIYKHSCTVARGSHNYKPVFTIMYTVHQRWYGPQHSVRRFQMYGVRAMCRRTSLCAAALYWRYSFKHIHAWLVEGICSGPQLCRRHDRCPNPRYPTPPYAIPFDRSGDPHRRLKYPADPTWGTKTPNNRHTGDIGEVAISNVAGAAKRPRSCYMQCRRHTDPRRSCYMKSRGPTHHRRSCYVQSRTYRLESAKLL